MSVLQLPLFEAGPWVEVNRYQPGARELADRHYSRRTPGDPQWLPPGEPFALLSRCGRAVWGVVHGFVPNTPEKRWRCSIFRNEGAGLSSVLIAIATTLTFAHWSERYGGLPPVRLSTEIDAGKIKRKRDPGRCFRRAGWTVRGLTPGGHGRPSLVVLDAPGENERVRLP